MSGLDLAAAVLAATLAVVPAAAERLEVIVDLSEQLMLVRRDGMGVAAWPVSSARTGKVTPIGAFKPYLLKRMHRSSLYNDAPMPHSIFFSGDYAIHGTTSTDRLGSPASAGCVWLHPDDARTLFDLVLETGIAETRIEIRE
jgi:lipoprotein-anchoring transpeptidase ErfK/SrfK